MALKIYMNPRASAGNKLFQTYQIRLIFRLQVLSVLFQISDNP